MDNVNDSRPKDQQNSCLNFVAVQADNANDPNANGGNGGKQWRAGYGPAPITYQFDDSNLARPDSSGLSSPFVAFGKTNQLLDAVTNPERKPTDSPPPREIKSSSSQTTGSDTAGGTVPSEFPESIKPSPKKESSTAEGKLFLGAAIASGSYSSITWGLDNHYARGSAELKEKMKWWEPHSDMLKSQAPMQTRLREAASVSEQAGKTLEKHAIALQQSKDELEALQKSTAKKLDNFLIEPALAAKQKEYVKSLTQKTVVPGSQIGTAEEVAAGEKLFVRGSKLADSVLEFEEALSKHAFSSTARETVLHRINGRMSYLSGINKGMTESDISLLSKQRAFLDDISNLSKVDPLSGVINKTDLDLINSKIGSAAELNGSKLFLHGSDQALMLGRYGQNLSSYQESLAALQKTKGDLGLAELALSKQVAKGAGSWLGRTLCGTGKGMLFAAGAMAIGYCIDQAGAALTHEK